MRTSITLSAAACVAGLSLAALSAPASADPGNDLFTLSCDNGHTYDIATTRGHGQWTPGFDSASTAVFLPLSFGNFVGAAYLASEYPGGEPLFSFDDPSVSVKPAKARGLQKMDCSFEQISVEFDPDLDADVIFVSTGDVTIGVRH